MSEYLLECGFYWRPLGGNNIDQISGHCYQYSDIVFFNDKKKITSIIIDLGKFDNHQALGIKNSIAAVPDIRHLLQDPKLNLEALLITHSHPDHLNGIIHYIKAGYVLPKIYGGKYTKLILEQLYDEFGIKESSRPKFVIINVGEIINIGSIKIEVLSSSHTCFDSLGFVITNHEGISVYHTGDMKTDNSTLFRKPTDLKRLAQMKDEIKYVVADFYGATEDGFAVREADTYKKLSLLIKKCKKDKIFVPVYPTHAEMYLIAFLAALKNKKDVIFYGDKDFYGYLELIKAYGIDFEKLAKNRIKVFVGIPPKVGKKFVVIGTFNNIHNYFDDSKENSFGIITSGTFFNPLRGQFNARGIYFADIDKYPMLQGFGHSFWGDIEKINTLLKKPIFIPTHCPLYIIDSCRELAKYSQIKIAEPIAKNNHLYKLTFNQYVEVLSQPASWLLAHKNGAQTIFTEVWQRPTSGIGFLKRTVSKRRCDNKFRTMLYKRKKGNKNGA